MALCVSSCAPDRQVSPQIQDVYFLPWNFLSFLPLQARQKVFPISFFFALSSDWVRGWQKWRGGAPKCPAEAEPGLPLRKPRNNTKPASAAPLLPFVGRKSRPRRDVGRRGKQKRKNFRFHWLSPVSRGRRTRRGNVYLAMKEVHGKKALDKGFRAGLFTMYLAVVILRKKRVTRFQRLLLRSIFFYYYVAWRSKFFHSTPHPFFPFPLLYPALARVLHDFLDPEISASKGTTSKKECVERKKKKKRMTQIHSDEKVGYLPSSSSSIFEGKFLHFFNAVECDSMIIIRRLNWWGSNIGSHDT